ncbi:MAG TPA: SUMF1/EgtB/PvdO family nonheme iron enzyme [Bacteroidales bacterium]|nr:SUMF1/EgtB/PvdO family nonheme iron enzyme [Bacteroidales bacterium]
MKRVLLNLSVVALIASLWGCGNSGNGELIGVQDREIFYQPDPYGMVFIPLGSYTMGAADQDVPYALVHRPRTVSLQAFYMDETEITNNEYRQFVHWVRDSLARTLLGDLYPEDYLIEEDDYGEPIDPPALNWDTEIEWDGEEERQALEELYYPEHERFYRRREIDPRKLNYEYYWIDYQAAAQKDFSETNNEMGAWANRPQGLRDRSVFIRKEVINVYPDTLSWIHDYAYSFNEPMAQSYFSHPAYDHYPVVGISWKQAKAFCVWRTALMNSYLQRRGEANVNEFRLPTEAEWEWAARGGLDHSPYPWGGPYIRNSEGCFLGNYKPLRGDYVDDGGLHTVIVGHYAPNDFGVYDMAGNVAEWTNDAFDESSYNFTWDLNPSYTYNALDSDPLVLKRKVVRGGSWKDIGYFMQVSARTYEYQDTAKCYIGFRCVQTYLGRQKGDNMSASSNVY